MKLIYNVEDKPQVSERIVFAFQQLLAIMAATIAVPAIVGNGMTASAALFGAGVGTLVYQLFTKFRSPVFLGSSFAFLGSMFAAFAGGVSMSLGFLGLILGAVFAGLVYVVFALIVKASGVQWINRLMPSVIIGPIVAIIGLSLAGNAVGDMVKGDYAGTSPYVALVCALVTLFVVILCSVYGSKQVRLIPFILGILAGYAVATCFTIIGNATSRAWNDKEGKAQSQIKVSADRIDFMNFGKRKVEAQQPSGDVTVETKEKDPFNQPDTEEDAPF